MSSYLIFSTTLGSRQCYSFYTGGNWGKERSSDLLVFTQLWILALGIEFRCLCWHSLAFPWVLLERRWSSVGLQEWRENGRVQAGRKAKFSTLANLIKHGSWLKSCQVFINNREKYICVGSFYLQNGNCWAMITQKCFTWKPRTLIIVFFWIHSELLMGCWKACFRISHPAIGSWILPYELSDFRQVIWTHWALSCLI